MKQFYLIYCCLLPALFVHAQAKKDSTGRFKKLLSHIAIQNTIDPLPDKPAPALLQFTFPQDKESSWLVDAAIGYKFRLNKDGTGGGKKGEYKWALTPVAEYHHNTLIEEEQYNWQTGVSVSFANVGRMPSNELIIGHFANMALKYSRNVTDTVSALLFTGSYDLFRSGRNGLNIGTYTFSQKVVHFFSLTPSYQFQYNFKANEKILEGSVLRPQISLIYETGSALEKEQRNANKKVGLSFSYTARYDVANSTGIREYYTQLLKAGLNIYLLNDPVVLTLSTSFNYGSDPAEGLKKQQYWLVGLQLQTK